MFPPGAARNQCVTVAEAHKRTNNLLKVAPRARKPCFWPWEEEPSSTRSESSTFKELCGRSLPSLLFYTSSIMLKGPTKAGLTLPHINNIKKHLFSYYNFFHVHENASLSPQTKWENDRGCSEYYIPNFFSGNTLLGTSNIQIFRAFLSGLSVWFYLAYT